MQVCPSLACFYLFLCIHITFPDSPAFSSSSSCFSSSSIFLFLLTLPFSNFYSFFRGIQPTFSLLIFRSPPPIQPPRLPHTSYLSHFPLNPTPFSIRGTDSTRKVYGKTNRGKINGPSGFSPNRRSGIKGKTAQRVFSKANSLLVPSLIHPRHGKRTRGIFLDRCETL